MPHPASSAAGGVSQNSGPSRLLRPSAAPHLAANAVLDTSQSAANVPSARPCASHGASQSTRLIRRHVGALAQPRAKVYAILGRPGAMPHLGATACRAPRSHVLMGGGWGLPLGHGAAATAWPTQGPIGKATGATVALPGSRDGQPPHGFGAQAHATRPRKGQRGQATGHAHEAQGEPQEARAPLRPRPALGPPIGASTVPARPAAARRARTLRAQPCIPIARPPARARRQGRVSCVLGDARWGCTRALASLLQDAPTRLLAAPAPSVPPATERRSPAAPRWLGQRSVGPDSGGAEDGEPRGFLGRPPIGLWRITLSRVLRMGITVHPRGFPPVRGRRRRRVSCGPEGALGGEAHFHNLGAPLGALSALEETAPRINDLRNRPGSTPGRVVLSRVSLAETVGHPRGRTPVRGRRRRRGTCEPEGALGGATCHTGHPWLSASLGALRPHALSRVLRVGAVGRPRGRPPVRGRRRRRVTCGPEGALGGDVLFLSLGTPPGA